MQWSPRPAEALALVAIGVGLALAVLALDPAGQVLVGAAALFVLALAARDLLLRPRLAVQAGGVVVRTLSGRQELPWPDLQVRVRTTRRYGIAGRVLELDTAGGPGDTGTLVLLGRRDLGADPAAVADALRRFDPRRS